MNKWSLLSIVLVVALLVSTTFWFGVTPKTSLVETDELTATPDFFLQGVTISQYDAKGLLVEQMQAQELKHYNATRVTQLVEPKVSYYQQSNTLEVSSTSGKIMDESNNMTLLNNVNVIKNKDSNAPIALLADQIDYIHAQKELIASGDVSVTSIGSKISADKVTLLIESNTLNIEGSVRGIHETDH